jgi:hypothetical protein
LASGAASLVYGEATLSRQTPEQKRRILAGAFRVLRHGGRGGIHELALGPDNIDAGVWKAIEREMSMNIHVGVRPVTLAEWRQLLADAGFQLEWQTLAPMHLLEPRPTLQIACHLLHKPAARQRVLAMRRMFRQYAGNLSAVAIVCIRPLR